MSNTWPDFNDMWDYSDPAATESTFRDLLESAKALSDDDYRLQLMTQIARTHSIRRNIEEAHAILDEVGDVMAGDDLLEVRYYLERGRTFNTAGETRFAIQLFEKAALLAKELDHTYYHIDALHMLGIAAPPEEGLAWNEQAIAAAKASDDARAKKWIGGMLNNNGFTYLDMERYDEALDAFERCAAFYQEAGDKKYEDIATWSIGKTLRLMGRAEEALAKQMALLDAGKSDGFTEEEIAECLLALDRADEARPYFKAAYDALSAIDWVAEDTARIERLKQHSEA